MSGNFASVVVCDFEYEVTSGDYNLTAGDLPKVLCMVAHVLDDKLRRVRTVRMWRGEFGSTPPFDVGPDTLFVAYSAWAEMTCFMALGWGFPAHIFDQHTAYLAASNILLPHNLEEKRVRPRKRLSDACNISAPPDCMGKLYSVRLFGLLLICSGQPNTLSMRRSNMARQT